MVGQGVVHGRCVPIVAIVLLILVHACGITLHQLHFALHYLLGLFSGVERLRLLLAVLRYLVGAPASSFLAQRHLNLLFLLLRRGLIRRSRTSKMTLLFFILVESLQLILYPVYGLDLLLYELAVFEVG